MRHDKAPPVEHKKTLTLSDKTSVAWVNNFTLFHSDGETQREIPWKEVHQQLASTNDTFRRAVKPKLSASEKDAAGDPKPNFLAVDISFLLAEPNKHGSKLVRIPIRVPARNLYSMRDTYFQDEADAEDLLVVGNSSRSRNSAKRLTNRHEHGKLNSPQKNNFTRVQKKGPGHYVKSKSPTYESKFHHSEQAFYEYISRHSSVKQLVRRLLAHGVRPKNAIRLIIIDMNSTRYVCGNCELGMQGLLNAKYPFLPRLRDALKKEDIALSLDDVSLAPRVLANKPDGSKKRLTRPDHNAPNLFRHLDLHPKEQRNRTIYEMDASVAALPDVETDFHRRTLFVSSHVKYKSKYKSTFENLQINEYAAMISLGLKMRDMTRASHLSKESNQVSLAFIDLVRILEVTSFDDNTLQVAARIQSVCDEHELQGDDHIESMLEQLNEVGVSYEEMDLACDDREFLDAVCQEAILEVLEAGYVSFTGLYNFHDIDLITDLANYNLLVIMSEYNLSPQELVLKYREDPMHLECMGGDMVEVLLDHAPDDITQTMLEYAGSDDLEFVRETLCESEKSLLYIRLADLNHIDNEEPGHDGYFYDSNEEFSFS